MLTLKSPVLRCYFPCTYYTGLPTKDEVQRRLYEMYIVRFLIFMISGRSLNLTLRSSNVRVLDRLYSLILGR